MEVTSMSKKGTERVCCTCGNVLIQENDFYKSYSSLYTNGYLPICKECFNRMFLTYVNKYGKSRIAMQRMCMAFDVYYSDDLFSKCGDDNSTVAGKYLKQLNMVQYKGKTYDEVIENGLMIMCEEVEDEEKGKSGKKNFSVSDIINNTASTKVSVNKSDTTEEDFISPEDVEKWGVGFDATDYAILNSHYRLLSNSNPNSESNVEIFIIDLCYTKMQQMKAVREGRVDDYNKLTESYRKSFQQAGLKTVKDTNTMEDFTIGVNAETIEKYTPAEYYKDKNLYKDSDDIGNYIERFLLRPLKNLMKGTRDRDTEFFVKEEETDGYSDDE